MKTRSGVKWRSAVVQPQCGYLLRKFIEANGTDNYLQCTWRNILNVKQFNIVLRLAIFSLQQSRVLLPSNFTMRSTSFWNVNLMLP